VEVGEAPGLKGGARGTDSERTPAFWPAMPLEGRGGGLGTGLMMMTGGGVNAGGLGRAAADWGKLPSRANEQQARVAIAFMEPAQNTRTTLSPIKPAGQAQGISY